MAVSLINLDDRRWTDLVQQGKDLLPFFAPDWTDYNLSDPGITLIELLAWLTEIDVYCFNRIPQSHILKFLKLVGSLPTPPAPAETVIQVIPTTASGAVTIPQTCEFSSTGNVTFRSETDVTVCAASLASIGVDDGEKLLDMTWAWSKGKPIDALGKNPKPGAAIYFGFDKQLPGAQPSALYLAFAKGQTAVRSAIVAEMISQSQACPPHPSNPCACSQSTPANPDPTALIHPSVVNVWEYFDGSTWKGLAGSQVDDQTRSLTLSGNCILTLGAPTEPVSVAMDMPTLHYVRCRFVCGSYDAAPLLTAALFNAIPAIQLQSGSTTLPISAAATISGSITPVGSTISPTFKFNSAGEINALTFAASGPSFRLLSYQGPAGSNAGSIAFEAFNLGMSTGLPDQKFTLNSAAASNPAPTLLTLLDGQWTNYQLAPDLDSAGWSDTIAAMDWNSNSVTFGDGQHGMIPTAGSLILLAASLTAGASGNVAARSINTISNSPHNNSFPNWSAMANALGGLHISNPLAATGGEDAMPIPLAEKNAMQTQTAVSRAVTIDDYKLLALQTPGFQIARVEALACVDPLLPCGSAAGIISLVVIPYLPLGHPSPNRALLQAVSNHLQSRRIPGTAIRIVGPRYVKVIVRVVVRVSGLPHAMKRSVVDAVTAFLHPISGGRTGKGWPLGQGVFATDILSVIAAVPKVVHVISLELFDHEGCKRDSSITLGTFGLPELGAVEVEVTPA